MSIASGARGYADNALDDTKSTLTGAQQRLGSLANDTRERARSAVGGTRSVTTSVATGVISVSRRQAYAQLGASDAVVAVITKRSAELPGDTKDKARQLVQSTKDGITKTAELVTTAQDKITSALAGAKDRGNAVVSSVRTSPARTSAAVKTQLGAAVDQLEDAYLKLRERGEQVAADLRHDPVVARVIGDADMRVEKAANQVTSVAQKVRARAVAQAERETAAATSTPVRPTAARQVPAHRTIVRNTPAGQAAISTTPIHRAAAQETEVRKAAAAKAAQTRKDNALAEERAAQARSEAAAKAAQTRKDNAQAEEQAAQARSEAATKAAATRKRNTEQANTGETATPVNGSTTSPTSSH